MKKTVWLSGSRGFVGSYEVDALLQAGYDVKCVSNSQSDNINIIFWLGLFSFRLSSSNHIHV